MAKDYGMITLKAYIDALDSDNTVSVAQSEIEEKVEKYLLNVQRAKTNALIIESLLS